MVVNGTSRCNDFGVDVAVAEEPLQTRRAPTRDRKSAAPFQPCCSPAERTGFGHGPNFGIAGSPGQMNALRHLQQRCLLGGLSPPQRKIEMRMVQPESSAPGQNAGSRRSPAWPPCIRRLAHSLRMCASSRSWQGNDARAEAAAARRKSSGDALRPHLDIAVGLGCGRLVLVGSVKNTCAAARGIMRV